MTKKQIDEAMAADLEEKSEEKTGSGYECFHCGQSAVFWRGDFTFEDYGIEGEGLIHVCECGNCGAEIEYYIRDDEEQEAQDDKKTI